MFMKKSKEIKSHVVLPVSVFRDHLSECLDLCVGGGRVFIDRAGTHYLLICIGDAMRKDDIVAMSEVLRAHTHSGVVDMTEVVNTYVNEVLPASAEKKDMPQPGVNEEAVVKVTGPIVNVEKFLKRAKEKRVSEYGCGCKKEEGKMMCGKHGRL
jgi:hypothetical protein